MAIVLKMVSRQAVANELVEIVSAGGQLKMSGDTADVAADGDALSAAAANGSSETVFPFFNTRLIFLGWLGRLPNFGSRPNTMGGKFPSVRPCVRPSTKSFFNFDKIWYTGSTR